MNHSDDFKRLLFALPDAPMCCNCGDATYSVFKRNLKYRGEGGSHTIPLPVCLCCARTLFFHEAAMKHLKMMMAETQQAGNALPSSLGVAVAAYERSLASNFDYRNEQPV